MPRPRGLRRYEEWDVKGLVAEVEYASFHMHAELFNATASEHAACDEASKRVSCCTMILHRVCGTVLSVRERERGVVCVDVMDVFER